MQRTTFVSVVLIAALITGTAQAQQAGKRLTLEERVTRPVTFSYDNIPLKEAVEDLKDKLNVPIVLHVMALEEDAINLEKGITGKSAGKSALEDINELLQPSRLAAEVRYDVLFISTWERQMQMLIPRFYRLREGRDPMSLVKQITKQTAVETWRDAGGTASIVPIGTGILAIFQAPATHREIERKYAKELLPVTVPIERLAGAVPTKGPNPIAKMRDALRRPVSAEYPETPLDEVVKDFEKRSKVKMVVDADRLKRARIPLLTPVTVSLKELPLESVLTLMFQGVGLAWTIDGEQILITTPEIAKSRLMTIAYDARDLAPKGDIGSLTDALTSTIAPESWSDVGGPGKIAEKEGSLSITQSVQVHRQIETWLADVRTALRAVGGR